MKVEITMAQLQSIKKMKDDIEAMLGGGGDVDDPINGDPDKHWIRHIRNINNFLKKNGYKP
ncbi:hypothetical protein TH53_19850 [Pedobacter lusitanus]|uniref:Contig93, whole genome shotgun sequence n=1 Tax=Pedobacter lusitanus TaxID=1503925 RepID=A0A0D0FT22_9SPHI|nr:hypothetical protein [Pedobacter lusitanus]KIO75594.1 hypothetical protein TH53_19850 [Pedobacter lusitanus]